MAAVKTLQSCGDLDVFDTKKQKKKVVTLRYGEVLNLEVLKAEKGIASSIDLDS